MFVCVANVAHEEKMKRKKECVTRGSISLIMCVHIHLYEQACKRLWLFVLYVCVHCEAVVDVLTLSVCV